MLDFIAGNIGEEKIYSAAPRLNNWMLVYHRFMTNAVRFCQIFASLNVVVHFYPWHILVFNFVLY